MALAYNADRATEDVDGTFEPRDVVLQAAASVAALEGDLDPNWLRDGVAQLMPPLPDGHPRSEQIGPALVISTASPEYVLRNEGDGDAQVAGGHR